MSQSRIEQILPYLRPRTSQRWNPASIGGAKTQQDLLSQYFLNFYCCSYLKCTKVSSCHPKETNPDYGERCPSTAVGSRVVLAQSTITVVSSLQRSELFCLHRRRQCLSSSTRGVILKSSRNHL